MPKNKGKRSSRRNARDIQTPFSDQESNSPKPETPASPTATTSTGPKIKGATQKQKPKKKSTHFDRSPTRKGDFAPGQSDGEYESKSDTDSLFKNASEQDAPKEDPPDSISPRVKKIIEDTTATESTRIVEDFFSADSPDYDSIKQLLRKLNQMIRAANKENDVGDIDKGTIPEGGYLGHYKTWRAKHDAAKEKNSPADAWEAFNVTHNLIRKFNKRYYLPKNWNISEAWAEHEIKAPNPEINVDSDAEPNEESESEDEAADLDDLEDLDALEARTMKEQRRLTSGTVLYWWRQGTGSQTFVRYGDRHTPIYRIRAGSHQSYDQHKVERVLTTKTRGNIKLTRMKNGLEEEHWKYERKHVKNILGVGWKVEGDDENDLDPLALLRPEKGVAYPHTKTLVRWKDDVLTLEGRAFMRRITTGSALDGDRVLYQKASELEKRYRKLHGLDEFESGFIEEERPMRNTGRQSEDDWSEDDTDSDSSVRLPPNRGRKRSESGRQQTPRSKQRNDEKIRSLERQLRQLKMDRNISPQRTNAKPRRRERTA